MAEGGPPRLESQKVEIENLLKSSLKKGDAWYLLDLRWFKQWKKYVGFDTWDTVNAGEETYNPGPIDNTSLFKERRPGEEEEEAVTAAQVLKEHLVDELDYVLVPEEAFDKLQGWYGIAAGQEPIKRHVIEQGMFVKHCKVEVYLMDLKLCDNADINTVVTKQFSRAATIEQLEQEMRTVFHIDENKEVRLWNRYMSNTYEHLNKKENTLQDAGLYQGQVIVVEKKNEDGTWPRQAKSTGSYGSTSYTTRSGVGVMGSSTSSNSSGGSSYSNYDNSSGYGSGGSGYYGSSYEKGAGSRPGLCGLSNLGNTCFMNSALQCMSNVPGLTTYMLSGQWEKELNRDNPLGMKGEIAISFAELIREMWLGARAYTVPRNFKVAVGRFAPQFSGYQQQDSQELMAFLLDGLHEDLNRIRQKPYIELKDGSGRDDAVVAREAWENYKKRNDSIIVDTFHGLLKSTVKCPDCQKISVTFDPFCYLSLPMPVKKERQLEVFWVSLTPAAKPVQYKLTVPKGGCVRDLCNALSQHVSVTSERMVVTDVYNHRFHKVFSYDEGLNHILDRDDIFIYEVPMNQPEEEYILVPIYFRHLRRRQPVHYASTNQLFGQPLIMAVPRNCTYTVLYNLLLARMARFVRSPLPGEVWWKVEKKEVEEEKASEDSASSSQQSTSFQSAMQHNGDNEEEGQSTGDVKMETESAGGDSGEGKTTGESEPSTSSSGKTTEVWNGNVSSSATATTTSTATATTTTAASATAAAAAASSTAAHPPGEDDRGGGGGAKKEGAGQEGGAGKAGEKSGRRIFTLSYVNSYGSSDNMPELQDNGRPLTLNNHTYLSVDWSPLAKSKFYDEKAAEDMEQHHTARHRHSQSRPPVLQLEDCLRLFTEAEQLSEQDPWYCPQCRKHQQATKKFDLWSLPAYLIIHLKRFSYNRYWRDKIDALVEFPTQGLDLRRYILNSENHDVNVYDLIAVTNHYGGLGGGHYTAYAQNKDDGEWYSFDDSSVSSASEESVVTKAAYVLVYKRRGADSPAHAMPKRIRQTEQQQQQEEEEQEEQEEGQGEVPPSSGAASCTATAHGCDINGYGGHSDDDDQMDVN